MRMKNSVTNISFPETADIETSSDGYAARFAGPVGEWMLGIQLAVVRDWLRAVGAVTVLDVGGGHGQLARPLADAGFQVTVLGSDAVCRKRIEASVADGRVGFAVGNVLNLPFPPRAFDAVVSVRLLPHCERWPELIRDFCRVAQRVVIVDYPTPQSLNGLAPIFFGLKKRMEGNTRGWRDFRHTEVAAEFGKHGWRPTARTGQFFLPMALHRGLRCRPVSAGAETIFRRLGLTRKWGSPVLARMERDI